MAPGQVHLSFGMTGVCCHTEPLQDLCALLSAFTDLQINFEGCLGNALLGKLLKRLPVVKFLGQFSRRLSIALLGQGSDKLWFIVLSREKYRCTAIALLGKIFQSFPLIFPLTLSSSELRRIVRITPSGNDHNA